MEVVVQDVDEGIRVDSFLSTRINESDQSVSEVTRSLTQKWLRSGLVLCNGNVLKPSSKLKVGDKIIIQISNEKEDDKKEELEGSFKLLPEKMKLNILHEDEDIIVLNKPKGLLVHGSPESNTGSSNTLVNGLLYHCMDNNGMVHLSNDDTQLFRPGIVHRIDRLTSGILVITKNNESHLALKEQFENHTITRKYICLCHGTPSKSNGRINSIIGRHPIVRTRQAILQDLTEYPVDQLESIVDNFGKGRLAKSAWKKLDSFNISMDDEKTIPLKHEVSLIEFQLFTGRTHQIRTQMQKFGHPLLFDPIYRTSTRKKTQLHLPIAQTNQEKYILKNINPSKFKIYSSNDDNTLLTDPIRHIGQILHASTLEFNHPITLTPMKFEAPIPSYFNTILSILKKSPK